MNVGDMRCWAVLALPLVVAGGCASRAWTEGQAVLAADDFPPPMPAHRAVERVTLHVRGHEFEFVGYRTCDPSTRDVRAQWLLDSGISVLDVAIHGQEDHRNSGSVFEAIPRFAETAMEDLRRTWGSRSVFCDTSYAVAGVSGVSIRFATGLTDGDRTYSADRFDDGSWVAVVPRDTGSTGPFHVTFLDRDLVPEATITYSDFDESGVAREIHLADLRDGHKLDVEVQEVRLLSVKDAATPTP